MPSAQYFVEGRYLGQSELPPSPFPYRSFAFFCPTCGEVWGRVVAGGSWDIIQSPCKLHQPVGVQDWGRFPGSLLWPSLSKTFYPITHWAICLDFLPPPVLQYEFDLAIKDKETL